MNKETFDLYKSKLVANLSHELKTPLTIIMAMADTLIHDPDLTKAQKTKYLERIHYNANALTQLIDDIITLHKIETQPKESLSEKQTRTRPLFADVKGMVLMDDERHLVFKTPYDTLEINQQHMLSILVNLVKNALAYTKSQTVTTRIEKEKGYVVVSVADEGPVIPEAERARIFERFYTISKSRAPTRSGSGLGLSIVKHISMLYNGDVRIAEKDGGNVFIVRLKEK